MTLVFCVSRTLYYCGLLTVDRGLLSIFLRVRNQFRSGLSLKSW